MRYGPPAITASSAREEVRGDDPASTPASDLDLDLDLGWPFHGRGNSVKGTAMACGVPLGAGLLPPCPLPAPPYASYQL
jgi:hypothetical protein